MKKNTIIYRLIFFILFILVLITSCQQINKKTEQNSNLLKNDSIKIFNNGLNSSSDIKDIPQDSMYALYQGSFRFTDKIKDNLTTNPFDYFKNINFLYFLVDSFIIEPSCKEIPFKLTDYYIFNKLNKSSGCAYIALVDTFKYIKIIGRQCVDMENWIVLYVFDNNYKIIKSELLVNFGGGDVDDKPLVYKGNIIKFIGCSDSLRYKKGIYKIYRSDWYSIKDSNGKKMDEIGHQSVKIMSINPDGVTEKYDSVTINKDFVGLYKSLNKY